MKDDLEKILVGPTNSIKETMNVINKAGKQIALIVDEHKKLMGIVTDGDIRRAILNEVDLKRSIENIMNKDFKSLSINSSFEEKNKLFKNSKINQIPLVDEDNHIKDIVLIKDLLQKEKKDNYVVLMAGGLGTRLRPLTEDTPKPLLQVGNQPILETIIEQFISYGFEKFIITINYKGDKIRDYFGDGKKYGINITYIEEKNRLGTAGALSLIEQPINKSFFLMNGDLLTKLNFDSMLNYHKNNNNSLTIASREYKYKVPYGVLNVKDEEVISLKEKPDHKFFVNAGIYVLNPELLEKIPYNQFYDIIELIDDLLGKDSKVGTFPIHEYWLDIGHHEDYKKAKEEYWDEFKEIAVTDGK